mgnify:CR=1 FL=1
MTLDRIDLSRIEARGTTASALILAIEALQDILDYTAGCQYDPAYRASIAARNALAEIAQLVKEK